MVTQASPGELKLCEQDTGAPNGDCERFPALAAVSSQELEQIGTLLFQLVHRALRGRLVRTPAQEAGAVPKTILRGVIVTNLHDELRLNGPPFA